MPDSANSDPLTDVSRDAAALAQMREQTFVIDETTFNCARGPDTGPPMILLHGVTRCWQDFAAILPGLTRSHCVWALDHRGHGGSSQGGSHYRIVDFVADAVAFIDAQISGPAVLLGHSLGAMVAAMVAAERPTQIQALILEDPPGTTLADGLEQSRFYLQFTNTLRLLEAPAWPSVNALRDALAAMQVQRPADGEVVPFGELRDFEALQFSAQCLTRLDPAVLRTLTAGRWLENLDWFERLSRIACPTLLLRADPDYGGMLSEEEASLIASRIPRCIRVDLPGVSHGIHAHEPERMLTLVRDFLQTPQALWTPS